MTDSTPKDKVHERLFKNITENIFKREDWSQQDYDWLYSEIEELKLEKISNFSYRHRIIIFQSTPYVPDNELDEIIQSLFDRMDPILDGEKWVVDLVYDCIDNILNPITDESLEKILDNQEIFNNLELTINDYIEFSLYETLFQELNEESFKNKEYASIYDSILAVRGIFIDEPNRDQLVIDEIINIISESNERIDIFGPFGTRQIRIS